MRPGAALDAGRYQSLSEPPPCIVPLLGAAPGRGTATLPYADRLIRALRPWPTAGAVPPERCKCPSQIRGSAAIKQGITCARQCVHRSRPTEELDSVDYRAGFPATYMPRLFHFKQRLRNHNAAALTGSASRTYIGNALKASFPSCANVISQQILGQVILAFQGLHRCTSRQSISQRRLTCTAGAPAQLCH